MKKLLSVILSALLVLSSFTMLGCNAKPEGKYTFYAPDGAPALAIAKFINDQDNLGLDKPVEYNVVTATEIGGKMANGIADIMIMPVNAASKFYKKGNNSADPYKMAAVITHGNLYIMSKVEIANLNQLKGKKIGVIEQVPELTFRSVLNDMGLLSSVVLENVAADKIAFKRLAGSEMVPLLKNGELEYGLLPEPAATNLESITSFNWHRLALHELYDNNEKAYPQAVLMVRQSVLQNNPSLINTLASKINENVTWAKENVATAVQTINDKLPQADQTLSANKITDTVIDNCKIYWQGVALAKTQVKDYITKISGISIDEYVPVVGAIDDDFFA